MYIAAEALIDQYFKAGSYILLYSASHVHSKSGVYSKYPDPTARMNFKSHNVMGHVFAKGNLRQSMQAVWC